MSSYTKVLVPIFIAIFLGFCVPVSAKKHFLDASPSRGSRHRGGGRSPGAELHDAVAAALGDGHDVEHGKLLSTRNAIQPMWNSLPKIETDRVEHRMLRYAVNRYFMSTYGVSIVGLEPIHGNGSHSEVKLLNELASSYVKVVLEGKGARDGFSVEDAVGLIATLERLILDSGSEVLEAAYAALAKSSSREVNRQELLQIFENYLLRWLLGDDEASIEVLQKNRTLLRKSFEKWDEMLGYLDGHIKSQEYSWQFQPRRSQVFRQKFSFEDAEVFANGVTRSFGRYWETECANIKQSLQKMDKDHTGRVRLADFYTASLGGEWRFSESKDYLRELGALDESSQWHGPRVIIPNYLQGSNNCIISSPHYRVCCANECEDFLAELELVLGSSATPDAVLLLVRNMSATLDDKSPDLTALEPQLRQIAKMHNGRVPFHGRLFAQWLHYVFPRECQFPHKGGSIIQLTPGEFGLDNSLATAKDMEWHAEDGDKPQTEPLDEAEKEWMSQWSDEEELLYENVSFQTPWEGKRAGGAFLFVLGLGIFAAIWSRSQSDKSAQAGSCLGSSDPKIHLI